MNNLTGMSNVSRRKKKVVHKLKKIERRPVNDLLELAAHPAATLLSEAPRAERQQKKGLPPKHAKSAAALPAIVRPPLDASSLEHSSSLNVLEDRIQEAAREIELTRKLKAREKEQEMKRKVERQGSNSSSSNDDGDDTASDLASDSVRSVSQSQASLDHSDASFFGDGSSTSRTGASSSKLYRVHNNSHHHHGMHTQRHGPIGSHSEAGSSIGSLGSCISCIEGGPSMRNKGEQRTIRELVHDIETRAKNNLPRPQYLPTLDSLPSNLLSWNGSPLDNMFTHAHTSARQPHSSVIDIIPCHQPVELLLVMADERSRKRAAKAELKKKLIEDHVQHVDAVIKEKNQRAARYQLLVQTKQRQATWLRIMVMGAYMVRLKHKYTQHMAERRSFFHKWIAASMIRRAWRKYYDRKYSDRYAMFFQMTDKTNWRMQMHIRIKRKIMATRRLTNFLILCKGQKQIATVVRRFLKNVHKTQAVSRQYLQCKQARLAAMVKLWDKLERSYIRGVLNRKKSQASGVVSTKVMEVLSLDPILKIEMRKQDTKWECIDTKMEDYLQKHRLTGDLNAPSTDESIEKFMLSDELKHSVLRDILERLRKEHLLARMEIIKRLQHQESDYSVLDVRNMLAGREVIRSQVTVRIPHTPFLLFKRISHKEIFDTIRSTHEKARTFAVYARQNSNLGMMNLSKSVLMNGPPSQEGMGCFSPNAAAARMVAIMKKGSEGLQNLHELDPHALKAHPTHIQFEELDAENASGGQGHAKTGRGHGHGHGHGHGRGAAAHDHKSGGVQGGVPHQAPSKSHVPFQGGDSAAGGLGLSPVLEVEGSPTEASRSGTNAEAGAKGAKGGFGRKRK